jgi:hypothetical protein
VNKAAVATAAAAVRRGSRARFAIWVFHFALPIAGLWLLLAQETIPETSGRRSPRRRNGRGARSRSIGPTATPDSGLLLVGLGFRAGALLFGLHARQSPRHGPAQRRASRWSNRLGLNLG